MTSKKLLSCSCVSGVVVAASSQIDFNIAISILRLQVEAQLSLPVKIELQEYSRGCRVSAISQILMYYLYPLRDGYI